MTMAGGAVFAGYTIIRQLGAGGMGEVYLAEHPRLPRRDALKILRAEFSADPEFRARFIREADSVAALSHPHIVTVFDRGETNHRLWIATQYVAGTDAAQLIRERYPAGMPTAEALTIITAIGDALDYAHDRGLLHRDVKPANILLADPERDGRRQVFLADFGIARPLGDPSGLTATNFTLGTVAYAAPEQLIGTAIDGRADQYALAATAYHLITGRPPFEDTNPVAVIGKHLTQPPPQAGATHTHLTALDPALSKAMAKDPTQRYPNCAAFTRDLTHAAPHIAVSPHHITQAAVPPPPPLPTPGPSVATQRERVNPAAPQQAPVSTSPPAREADAIPHKKPAAKRLAAILASLALLVGLGIGVLYLHHNRYYVEDEGDGRVAIWRGLPLWSEPFLLGCIDAQGTLSQVRYNASHSGCEFLRLEDLKPSERAQVEAGLPSGSLDDAIAQLQDLASTALPPCVPGQVADTNCRNPAARPAPSAAQSGPISPLTLSEPLTDLANALDRGQADQVRTALAELQRRNDIQLRVVYVDTFSSGARDWAEQTLKLSEMSGRYAILAVAIQQRSYAFLVAASAVRSSAEAEVDSLRFNSIEPALKNDQWAQAAIAAANGLTELAAS